MREYGGSATSFSPQLLSCAAVVRDHSKGGTFVSLPDWTTVSDDDPRIKGHPRFHKTHNYRPSTSTAATIPADTQPTAPTQSPTQLANKSLATDFNQLLPSPAVPDIAAQKTAMSPLLIPVEAPSLLPPAAIEPQTPPLSMVREFLEPLTPIPPSFATNKNDLSSAGNLGNVNEVADGNVAGASVPTRPAPRPLSRHAGAKRKKKFMSDEEDDKPTGTIHVARKVMSVVSGKGCRRNPKLPKRQREYNRAPNAPEQMRPSREQGPEQRRRPGRHQPIRVRPPGVVQQCIHRTVGSYVLVVRILIVLYQYRTCVRQCEGANIRSCGYTRVSCASVGKWTN